jgi:hypothetical protein
MNHAQIRELVLAIYPTTRGFGFVLMTSPLSPVDWGTKEVRGGNKNAQCLAKVAALINAHQPDVIVLEDATAPGSRRALRIRRLSRAISSLAEDQAIDVHNYSRGAMHECFDRFGARTRYEIAMAIAKRIAAFERFLPPPRKLWMSEDVRMSIFNAAALAIVVFESRGR